MEYGFNLNWDELDEDLRTRKIDEYITYTFNENCYDQDHDLDWYLKDEDTRNHAEDTIKRYFPIYF